MMYPDRRPGSTFTRMDWFERITGFKETDYETTRSRMSVDGEWLISAADGRRHGIGVLTMPTLGELRSRVPLVTGPRTTVRCLSADARELHSDPAFAGATVQVASQFNLLEMVGPQIGPEHGVTRYIHDATQGPACAIAAGAATIYRNYLVPVDGGIGQTSQRQIDTLASLGEELAVRLGRRRTGLWTMHNGYALCTAEGLAAIERMLGTASEAERDELRDLHAVGVHRDVEVTDVDGRQRPRVTQVFCSALPVAYTRIPAPNWTRFATLVLEAAYEATLLAACEQVQRGGSNTVLLTRLGGGAFGNDRQWIDGAIQRALRTVEYAGLDVRLVSRGAVEPFMRGLAERWS